MNSTNSTFSMMTSDEDESQQQQQQQQQSKQQSKHQQMQNGHRQGNRDRDDDHDKEDEEEGEVGNDSPRESLSFLDRLEHFTWAWYTLPMATGGMSLLLSPSTQPHVFPGLNTIGKVVYVFDLVVFSMITMAMTYRFVRWPHLFRPSLTHPTEGLFFATFWLAMASIIAGMARYAIPTVEPGAATLATTGTGVGGDGWLVVVYRVLFWIYFACTLCGAVGQYTVLFTSPALKIQDMTPAWDLPIFPFMLCGTVAASGAQYQPQQQAVPMIVGGLMAQGLGFGVSVLMYASYVRRMIQWGFPSANTRPAMFIAVGPPSFTALALIGMANDFPLHYEGLFSSLIGSTSGGGGPGGNGVAVQNELMIQVLKIMATFVAVFIWSLSLWFFCISVIANLLARKELSFHLNWWAYVFPNVGFVIATISIGKAFQSQGILWVGSVATILLVVLYLFIAVNHVLAVWQKRILWPGKDEDVYRFEKSGKRESLKKLGKKPEKHDLEKQE